jgi:UDP-N-acetylglucosamine diphosphorylase / glucose-1-phosphate thymidylyltransferase / UDP-N-acetylgalactosamine diphosphorylase / glucosamine-1-phosphate N-acetyltransferase / galactosamine-1-phosphate N-acetyltransferase
VIDRAVLLAAGRGTRLGALTANFPKPLLEVGGRPIIVHILEGLARAGIAEVTIVTGHFADLLETEIGNGDQAGLRIRYLRQSEPDGTARALALARDHVGAGQFFAGWGDILVLPENYARIVKAARFADIVVAVNEVDDPFAGAAVYVDEDMRVQRIVEKPDPGTSTTRWNNAGFSILGPAIWPEIDRLQPSARGEYELPQAVAALVDSGVHVRAVPVEGPWFDVGTPEELDRAREVFGSRRGGTR